MLQKRDIMLQRLLIFIAVSTSHLGNSSANDPIMWRLSNM